ncbi:signal peptidase II [Saccharothrix texasensis]|uniref:Lipoprotein signal peptidase n=1 Tax=Saccharothrix texasensis TaxID=103734 RepID=A0A3N1H433_9PSEU|nr:signal peptidase II [Saccharothrix texasensis]ROP37284.1 signal peptidase II [Saccharothrix texasensis]
MAVVALLVAALDLAVKAWAETTLPGNPIDLGPLDLRLTFNSGVAFSLGDSLPATVVVAVTGAIVVGIMVYAWRSATSLDVLTGIGLGAVLGGAMANLLDRASDGAVTDYLHTGWFATFNLADTGITLGAALLILAALRNERRAETATTT